MRIWQVYGGSKTAKDAAQEFARSYWAEARKITGFKPDGTFKAEEIQNGMRNQYACKYNAHCHR